MGFLRDALGLVVRAGPESWERGKLTRILPHPLPLSLSLQATRTAGLIHLDQSQKI